MPASLALAALPTYVRCACKGISDAGVAPLGRLAGLTSLDVPRCTPVTQGGLAVSSGLADLSNDLLRVWLRQRGRGLMFRARLPM